MKTYRVRLRRNDLSPRVFTWDVDAKGPAAAINKALKNIAAGSGNIDVSIRLLNKCSIAPAGPDVREAVPGGDMGRVEAGRLA